MRRLGPKEFFASVLLGVFLLQAAWVLTIPPFRGLDEHDHAYKAAAVARGDWSPHHEAKGKWGEVVEVPADLVRAASRVCKELVYTDRFNCRPIEHVGGGQVTVTSSAATYDPAYYWVVGTVARPFHGAQALFAMRLAGAVLCAVLIALAALVTRTYARTPLPMVALTLACTPVLLYSTAMTAPNGLELAAALLLWCSLLAVVDANGVARRLPLATGTLAALIVAVVRSFGPLWLVLIVGTCALLLEPDQRRALAGRRAVRVLGGLVALALVAGAAWTVVAGTNSPGHQETHFTDGVWGHLPGSVIVWVLQSIAAFPARDELAPMGVYVIGLAAWWCVALFGIRRAQPVVRRSMLVVVVVSLLIPTAITVASYSTLGIAWQGRYGYPFALGFVLLCGLALDRATATADLRLVALVLVGELVMVLWSTLHVVSLFEPRASDFPGWIQPSTIQLAGLVVVGYLTLGAATLLGSTRVPTSPSGTTDDASAVVR